MSVTGATLKVTEKLQKGIVRSNYLIPAILAIAAVCLIALFAIGKACVNWNQNREVKPQTPSPKSEPEPAKQQSKEPQAEEPEPDPTENDAEIARAMQENEIQMMYLGLLAIALRQGAVMPMYEGGAVTDEELRQIEDIGDVEPEQTKTLGKDLILEHILNGVDKPTLDAFDNIDLEKKIFDFILAKAVFLYVFGAKKEEQIPDFFKDLTITKILELRAQNLDGQNLAGCFNSIDAFNAQENEGAMKEITAIAGLELAGGKLITLCYQAALKERPNV